MKFVLLVNVDNNEEREKIIAVTRQFDLDYGLTEETIIAIPVESAYMLSEIAMELELSVRR